MSSLTALSIKKFFIEIYQILKESNQNINAVWYEIDDINFFRKFDKYELMDFIDSLNFISLKKGNYMNYIVINKIQFITSCYNYLDFDIQNLAELVDYNGFEILIKEILSQNGFRTVKNFRFSDKSNFKSKTSQKRYEIDVIALSQKYLLIIDAKQWKRKDSYGAINKAANLQVRRVVALKENPEILSNLIQRLLGNHINIKKRLPLILVPIMVTLEANWIKINENSVPLVAIYQFNSFLQELGDNIEYFKKIKIDKLFIQKQLV
ncbi:MAG: NERD domain-containing protein [Candidatus Thorarchaeota archaeon]